LEEEEEQRCKGLKPKPADDVLDEEGPRDLLNSNRTTADNEGNEGEGLFFLNMLLLNNDYYLKKSHELVSYLFSHGDLIYVTFEDGAKPGTSAVFCWKRLASTVGPFEPTANTSSSSALNVKQEVVDDYLEKQSGFIKRGCAPKLYA
ncbi:4819_t:CDS:2, partial [Ambispora gerdemannii]